MGQTVDKERLIELLEPAVAALGYELTDLDAHLGRRGLLRVFIDRPDGGVTLADCERVSDQLGAFLDIEDPLPGSYVLEVSSPGLDRPLRGEADYRRFIGRLAKIVTVEPVDGQSHFAGRLSGVEGGVVLLAEGRRMHRVPLDRIGRARLEVEF